MNLSGESSNSKRHQRSLSITESEMLERLDLTSNVDEVMENDTEKIVLGNYIIIIIKCTVIVKNYATI